MSCVQTQRLPIATTPQPLPLQVVVIRLRDTQCGRQRVEKRLSRVLCPELRDGSLEPQTKRIVDIVWGIEAFDEDFCGCLPSLRVAKSEGTCATNLQIHLRWKRKSILST